MFYKCFNLNFNNTAIYTILNNLNLWTSCFVVCVADQPGSEEPVGEVSVQVDLFTHPGTGEHKVTVKGKKKKKKKTFYFCFIFKIKITKIIIILILHIKTF